MESLPKHPRGIDARDPVAGTSSNQSPSSTVSHLYPEPTIQRPHDQRAGRVTRCPSLNRTYGAYTKTKTKTRVGVRIAVQYGRWYRLTCSRCQPREQPPPSHSLRWSKGTCRSAFTQRTSTRNHACVTPIRTREHRRTGIKRLEHRLPRTITLTTRAQQRLRAPSESRDGLVRAMTMLQSLRSMIARLRPSTQQHKQAQREREQENLAAVLRASSGVPQEHSMRIKAGLNAFHADTQGL